MLTYALLPFLFPSTCPSEIRQEILPTKHSMFSRHLHGPTLSEAACWALRPNAQVFRKNSTTTVCSAIPANQSTRSSLLLNLQAVSSRTSATMSSSVLLAPTLQTMLWTARRAMLAVLRLRWPGLVVSEAAVSSRPLVVAATPTSAVPTAVESLAASPRLLSVTSWVAFPRSWVPAPPFCTWPR